MIGLGARAARKSAWSRPSASAAGRALLGVGRQFVFQVAAEGRHEAGRRRHGPALLDAAEPGGHGAAAGVAGDADVPRVDLGPRQQVVQGPDAVPGAPGAEELAHQELLVAGVDVLGRARSAARLPAPRRRTGAARPGRWDRRSARRSPAGPVPGQTTGRRRPPCR